MGITKLIVAALLLASCGLDGAVTGSQRPAPDTAQKSQNILICQDNKTTTVSNTTNQSCDKSQKDDHSSVAPAE